VGENIIAIGLVHWFSFTPPMVGIGVHPKRHSHGLLKKMGDFGVNIPVVGMEEQVDLCGTISGRDANKFERSGLTPMRARVITSKLIEECPVNMECRIVKELSFGSHDWFVGEVVAAHMDEGYDREKALQYWKKEYRAMGDVILKK
jgi:flavin reductase (DIM6/NTAB) family NADH-FMN oxidoreductase RutF